MTPGQDILITRVLSLCAALLRAKLQHVNDYGSGEKRTIAIAALAADNAYLENGKENA